MKKLSGFENATTYTQVERLPIGGYVLDVLDVKYQENTWGDVIELSFDIAEGEKKDFYKRNYEGQTGEDRKWKGKYRLYVPKDDGSEKDEWTMRTFKTAILAFETSNPGFHWEWDEQKLKGKKIGAVFNNKEYSINGKQGFFTNCHHLETVEVIRENTFKMPNDTLLKGSASNNTPRTDSDGFMNVPEDAGDALPF